MRTLSIVAVLLLLVTAGCAGVGGKYVVNETGMITVQLPPELYRLAIEKGMDPELLLARAGAGSAPASERGPGGQTGNVETTGRGESNQGSRNPFARLVYRESSFRILPLTTFIVRGGVSHRALT